MSKPRARWWGYVRRILNDYPNLLANEEHLDDNDRRELQAVAHALGKAECFAGGDMQIRIVRRVFFDKTHTLVGAAMAEHISYATAKRRQNAFILLVGKEMGFCKS